MAGMDGTSVNAFLREPEKWTDRHGNVHRLTDMTEGYLRHVMSFLEERAETYFQTEIEEVARQHAVAVFEPWRCPDAGRPLDFESAHAWLESTPLVRAIHALLGTGRQATRPPTK